MNVFTSFNQFIKSQDIHHWLISLILITLPLKHSVNSLFIIITVLYFIYNYFSTKKKPRLEINNITIVFISIYILAFVSLLWSVDLESSFEGLSQKLSYLILPIVFVFIPKINTKNITIIFSTFSKAIVFYALYCLSIGLVLYFKNNNINALFYHNLSKPLNGINAIYLSTYTAFAILYFFTKKTKQKRDYFYLTLLSLFLILLSSKLLISVTLFSIIASLLYYRKNTKKRVLKTVFLISTLIVTIFISKKIIDRFTIEIKNTNYSEVFSKKEFGQVYFWTGTSLRLFQIRAFYELLKEDRLFFKGYGIDASQAMLKKKYVQYNLYPGFYNYNFHNQYIQIFSELGILGLLFLISIFYFSLKEALVNKNFLFLSFTFLIAILCITESFLWRQRGMVFFITVTLLFFKDSSQSINIKKIEKKIF